MDQNPPSIKWQQINSAHFKIIFPEGFDKEAQRTANTLEHLYLPVSRTLERLPRKIPIILQNQTTVSNAFVTISPRRSEFFTMPPQDYNFIGTNDWIDLLAIHEFRHVVQFEKSITGFNKFIYYLFGAEGLGAMSFMAVPIWFWEGDAVAIETALTESGRGRIPYFDLLFRTNLLERGGFSYSKQYLGSFRHRVPNHYVTGYFMTTHLRRKHGPFVWSKVTERAFMVPFIPFAFSLALKKETGAGVRKNYRNMIAEVDSLWKQQIEGMEFTQPFRINKRKKETYTNYQFPQELSDGRTLVLKSGIGDISKFVAIDDSGTEEELFTPGIMNLAGMISATGDKIVWNEFQFDPRWRARNYSVVKLYDINEKQLSTLTTKSRYSAAAISPDGKKIVTIEVTPANENFIVVLDAKDGQVIQRIANPENYFFSMPRWSDDNINIVVLKHKEKRTSILLINTENFKETSLFEKDQVNMGHPVIHGNYLFFNAAMNGIDNIYAKNLENQLSYQVTTAKFGAYNPNISADGASIIYNEHQKNGMDVVKIPFDTTKWQLLNGIKDMNIQYYQPLVDQEQNQDVLEHVPQKVYTGSKYKRATGLINPYSWGASIFPQDRELFIGATSQDILSTTSISAGLTINANESTGFGFAQVSYQGFYPIIDVGARYGYRSTTLGGADVNWRETGLNLGLRLPLILTRSKFMQTLNVSVATSLTQVDGYDAPVRTVDQQANGILHHNKYRVSHNYLLKRNQRDLFSRYGVSSFVQLQHTPFGGDYSSSLLAAEANLFFPGLIKHHSIQLRTSGQLESNGNYIFPTPLLFPRGYAYQPHKIFYNFSFMYSLPLVYPDLAIGPFLYIQRIKTNLFYDHGRGLGALYIDGNNNNTYYSLGVELTTDFNIMRFLPLLEIGVRYVYLPETGNYSFQLLLGQFGI
ncbi:MAG: hypothetical protein M3512_12355 [Bacteroidota bacterium]|nr:hypothetical protein [Bacteroidota bacterium]